MKVLLLNPPYMKKFSRDSRSPEVTKGGCTYFPYHLAMTAGVLEKEGFEIKIIDGVANNYNQHTIRKSIEAWKPELVVINTSTPSIENDVAYAKIACDYSYVILVGTHPSAMPEETLNLVDNSKACVAIGEYEYTVRDLAKKMTSDTDYTEVDGLSFYLNDLLITTNKRKPIENLDELPFISKTYQKYFDIKKYSYPTVRSPQVTILTSRGCKFTCSFCTYANVFWKGQHRFRSIENVVDELEYIRDNLSVKEIMFEDATFAAQYTKERVIKLCQRIVEKGLKISWVANARYDTDFETLSIMKKAGCRELCVGFESSEQQVLKEISKGTLTKQAEIFMNICNSIGILVHGCFVLGLPKETKGTIEKTINFAIKLNPDTVQFYPALPEPGTPLHEWTKKNNYLITDTVSEWLDEHGHHRAIINRPDLPAEYVDKKCNEALKRFYWRKEKIFSIMSKMFNNYSDFKRYMNGFLSFILYK